MTKTFVPGEILTASDVNGFLVNKIVDVKSVFKSDTFSGTATSAGLDITGLSITHEVSHPDNKVFLIAQIGQAGVDLNGRVPAFAFAVGGSLIGIGDAAGTRYRTGVGNVSAVITGIQNVGTSHHLSFLHSPGAGSKTYTVRFVFSQAGSGTVFVNRSASDGDSDVVARASSSFTLMEVAG